jgi:phosphoribosylformylglycinamidine synthase subunit PurL
LPSQFQNDGNTLLMVGVTTGEFGGSLYLKELYDATVGSLSDIDYTRELRLWELVIEANKEGLLESAKDLSMGGIAIALAKMSAVSNKGCQVCVSLNNPRDIFDESQSRAILEVEPANVDKVVTLATSLGLKVESIGNIGGEEVVVNDVSFPLEELRDIYFGQFVRVIEQDL